MSFNKPESVGRDANVDGDLPALDFGPGSPRPTSIATFKTGKVVSDRSQKTLVVEVEHRFEHPRYKRIVVQHRKFHVHDEAEVGWLGDIVEIRPCRPRSALKRFELVRIIRQGDAKRSIWQVLPMKLVAEITNTVRSTSDLLSCALRFSLAPSQDELFTSTLPKMGRSLAIQVQFSSVMVEVERPTIVLLYNLSKKWSSSEMVNLSLRVPERHFGLASVAPPPSIEASVIFQDTLIQIRRFRLDPEKLQERGAS